MVIYLGKTKNIKPPPITLGQIVGETILINYTLAKRMVISVAKH
jgi:hypothetical protein